MDRLYQIYRSFLAITLLLMAGYAVPATAQSCSPAATQGTAPPEWETYCWLDFSSFNDATARTAAGQNLSFTLTDGSILSLNAKVTPTAATAFNAIVAPSWTGAAVGNTAFLGIPGKPVIYTTAAGSKSISFSNIFITPPPGAPAVTVYAFVAADAESTNNSENLQFVTNGGGWTILDQVNPISGSNFPTITGAGTSTFTETGVAGTVGGYIVGSDSPTTVTANMQAGGLQGAMFAVRFASIRLFKTITGARVNAADQFKFGVTTTTAGTVLASGTTTGTGNGPYAANAVSLASGISLTLSETMASGSISALTKYDSRLTCINGAVSSTPLPNNVNATTYDFGALQFGDAVRCTFTNAAYPHLVLQKALGTGGRKFSGDQFTLNILNGATNVATTTTTGTGTTITNNVTAQTQVSAGTPYTLNEVAAGSGSLTQYTSAMACVNAATGSSTALPTTTPGTVTPALGDVITCTITNTRKPPNANLVITKTSTVVSDGVSATNPKAIPGAVVRYTISVTNTGDQAVDASTIVITDPLPSTVTYGASSPVVFTNGATVSGLNAFNASTMVTFSNQPSGGAPYTYSPNTAGYDAGVKGIRIAPTGTLAAASSSGQPSFTVSFLAKIN